LSQVFKPLQLLSDLGEVKIQTIHLAQEIGLVMATQLILRLLQRLGISAPLEL